MSLTTIPEANEFNMLETIAKNAQVSGLYSGIGGKEKIFMILLAARELGVSPMIALNGGIWNIQGRIEISARLMNAMIRRKGHTIKLVECNAKICTLEGKRTDTEEIERVSFSWDDAIRAGLANRDSWKKYSEDMLYSRAMSRLARRLFPDIIGTAYVEGEIADEKTMKPHNIEDLIETPSEEIPPAAIEQKKPINEPNEFEEKELWEFASIFATVDASKFYDWMRQMMKEKEWSARKAIDTFDKHQEHTLKTFQDWLASKT